MAKRTTISIRYEIAQNVRSWILKRKYTLKDLADKTGIKYHTLLRYEQGACGIPTKKLKIIAKELSIHVRNLFPRQKMLREKRCFDKARTQWMYNFIGKYMRIEGREQRKAIYALTKSTRAEEESDIKAARVRMAKNLVEAGYSADIIYRATSLSADEYDNKEKKTPKRQNGGQEIKKWRVILGYTQEDLAKELGVGSLQIHHYEQDISTMVSERLWEISRKLIVDAEDLMKESTEEEYYEDGEAENELLSWSRESKKINNQESRDELDIWVEFFFQRKQIYQEKIDKAEAIKVANNLLRLGVSIDVIPQVTGVSAEEIF